MDPTRPKLTEAALLQKEARLAKLSGCFLGFGNDPDRNISAVVALCGELLGGCCALYNRLGRGKLCSAGMWQAPAGYQPEDAPEGHICYDVIRRGGHQPLVVRNLPKTHYARTDPNVSAYGLQTYIGQPVRCGEQCVGSLCVVYREDFEPRAEHLSLLGILASAIGVEERRRQAAEELLGNEQRLRILFEMAPDAYFLTDLKGTLLDGNRAAEAMCGYARQELIGRNVLQIHLLPTEQLPKVAAVLAGNALGQPAGPEEFTLIRKDGRQVPIEIRTYPVTMVGQTCVLAIARDITLRKEAEAQLLAYQQQLRESGQRLDAMLRSIGDHMSMLDRDLNIVWANDVAKSMFGQDLVGRKCYEAYHGRTEPCEPYPCLTLRAFEDGKVHEHDVQVIDKDGQARYFHCTTNVALRDAEGQPATVLELSRDITAIKQAETQLLAYQKQLRALTAQVSSAEERERRSLATELHDHIGQTLAVAKIKLGRARKEAGNSPVAVFIGEVHGLIDRTIQDTRSLAFQLSPPLLHELGFVEAVEWLVEQFRSEHDLPIEVRSEGGALPLGGDLAGMLFRGVRELLMNVVKHARAGKARVTIGRDGPNVRVEVRDDGDGFDASGYSAGGGSGFGLFSLRERLSYLGGRLEIESARGQGTRVVMLAPSGEGQPAEGAP